MTLYKNLRIFLYLFLIIYSVTCAPSGTGEENDKQEKETDSSKEDSDEKETISPEKVEEPKEEITENQKENAEKLDLQLTSAPDQIKTFSTEEEKEHGKDLPEKVEESITDAGVHFIELFDKIEIESGEKEEEEEEAEPKSPEEVMEMKDEIFRLINEVNEKEDLPEGSREDFDRVWKQKEEMYGKRFPKKIERMLALLKKVEEKEEPTTGENITEAETEAPSVVNEPDKEEIPINAFALKNAEGKICILAKFHTAITIIEQNFKVDDPSDVHVKGNCGDGSKSRQLHLSWENFIFTLVFNKTEDTWVVNSIEFNYDTSDNQFDGGVNGGKVSAKSNKGNFFETPLGKSYICPAPEAIPLFSENRQVVIVRLKEVHIQPYDVEDGKFSTNHRCNQVGLDDEPFVQDETIPLAVGCTLALITLLILVGFSVHRAYNAAKVDYNTME